MAGTRTAPLMTAAATSRSITLHLIDVSNDLWAEQLPVPVAASAANIETWIAAYVAASNASLYGVSDNQDRMGDADPDNAVAAFRGAVENGINLLFKNPATKDTIPTRLVAPIAGVMQGNQDIPLLSADEMSALILAEIALNPTYGFNKGQYTVRKERKNNPRVG